MASGNETGPALILLSGLPGTGKTTFARELAGLLPARHIESDAVRREIFPRPRYTSIESRAVFADVDRRLKRALAAGEVAIIDATNLEEEHRARLRGFALAWAAAIVEVRLVAPPETVRRRLEGPRYGHSQADWAVYEGMRGNAQPSTWPVVTADTRYGLEPALRVVLAKLGQSRRWVAIHR